MSQRGSFVAGVREARLLDAITSLTRLEQNWNGYGAPPIQQWALDSAKEIVRSAVLENAPEPQIIPVGSGTIQFEWYKGKHSLEAEIEPGGVVHYLLDDEEGAFSSGDQESWARLFAELNKGV